MLVIRATEKLRRHWKLPPPYPTEVGTNTLGDLYAHIVPMGRRRVILGMFERTFLPVLVPVTAAPNTVTNLVGALGKLLEAIGVSTAQVDAELAHMGARVINKTASRVVLGVMNDFTHMLSFHEPGEDFHSVALWLADTPVSPLAMVWPIKATLALFEKPRPHLVKS